MPTAEGNWTPSSTAVFLLCQTCVLNIRVHGLCAAARQEMFDLRPPGIHPAPFGDCRSPTRVNWRCHPEDNDLLESLSTPIRSTGISLRGTDLEGGTPWQEEVSVWSSFGRVVACQQNLTGHSG